MNIEATAEAFYQLGIPFTAITLRLFGGQNDFDIVYAAKYCKDRNIEVIVDDLTHIQYKENNIFRRFEMIGLSIK